MEMEAVIQEQASLENQLASLGTLISNLASEVEEQKSTVSICIYFDQIFFCSARLFSQPYEQQIVAVRNNLDQVQSELKSVRLKMKECDKEISAIVKEQQKLEHKITENNLERKRMENEVIF